MLRAIGTWAPGRGSVAMRDAPPFAEAAAQPVPPRIAGERADGGSGWVIDRLDPAGDYNFRHFRIRHMLAELLRT